MWVLNKALILLFWTVLLDYFIDNFSVCMRVSVFFIKVVELIQRFSLYTKMTSPPESILRTLYEGYSESKYRLLISLTHPRDCPFAHVQWLPLLIEKPQTPFREIRHHHHHHNLYFPFIHFRVHSQGCGNSQV